MEESYAVDVRSSVIPVAGDRPVVFHGVNKSGSLAMTDVMRAAYAAQGRGDQISSTYHRFPGGLENFSRVLPASRGHHFFVSHYVYGRMTLPPDAILISQVRHPVPRALSVYGWIMRSRVEKGHELEDLPTVAAWVRSTRGVRHTQMAQFASRPGADLDVKAMASADVLELALENFNRDVDWFGVAEIFEESIFALAHMCGLPAVPPWQKDLRNRGRPALAGLEPATRAVIEETLADEMEFYRRAVETFRERVRRIDFGPSLTDYKTRCSAAYGERLLSA